METRKWTLGVGKMEIIDFRDSLPYRLSKYLEDYGFKTAYTNGEAVKTYDADCAIGIVSKQSSEHWKQFIKLFPLRFLSKNKRIFLGVIWFKDSSRNATRDNWVFEVYGRENLSIIEKLAINLEKNFDVQIVVHILSDELRFETFGVG